jgi:ribosome-binding ATPase YchF (GTP1/OBG family)
MSNLTRLKPQTHPTTKQTQEGATSNLPKIITTGFRAIHLIYFFTAGADEVKCWQIRKGAKAPQVHVGWLVGWLVVGWCQLVC